MIGQAVADDEPLPVLDVEVPHRGELFSSGRVQDLEDAGRAVHLDLFPVKVFDGRVVLLHEVAGHELNGQSRFADTPGPENDHFEFAHFRILVFDFSKLLILFRVVNKLEEAAAGSRHLNVSLFG